MQNLVRTFYDRPKWMLNQHLETIVPSVFRRVDDLPDKERVKINTNDEDFLLIDWYSGSTEKAIIISHGLEGDSERPYVLGMVRRFCQMGWSVFAWNFRSCGGEMNRQARMYHSGATQDLACVIDYVKAKRYTSVSLIGFSLGGNLTLKYLGEFGLNSKIDSTVVFSVPLDLASCSDKLDSPGNWFYARRFLRSLTKKIKEKKEQMPHILPHLEDLKFKSMFHFDDAVTAPLHGFDGALHYYYENSSKYFIDRIKVPTLVVNAQNDPFLTSNCLDPAYFESTECVYFEVPKYGGHVGFTPKNQKNVYWSEEKALRFITLQQLR